MKAIPVAPITLPCHWPQVEGWIAKALAKAKADIALQDVHDCIAEGKMQLWLVHDGELRGCCVTEVHESVRGRCCNLIVVAGNGFSRWKHLESDIAAWAITKGCKRLTLQGRAGWTRRLANGWRKQSVAMEKDI